MTSNAQKQIHANELLALNLETDENGNKVVIDLPISLPEELQSFAGQFYELSPTLKTMMVDHDGSKEPLQGQERAEPLRRPVSSVPQAPSVSTLPGPINGPQSTTKPAPGAKRGRPPKLSGTLKIPVANKKNQNVPVTGPTTQASKPVVGRKRGGAGAKGHLVGAPLPPLQPNRQGAKNVPQSQLGVNGLGPPRGSESNNVGNRVPSLAVSVNSYSNAQANTVGVYNTPAPYSMSQREWECLPTEMRHAFQHFVAIDYPQVATPRQAGFVQSEPPWGYAPYVQAEAATAGTPSRGFVWQQPAPGQQTTQNVGSPVIPPPSVVATGTRYVPTPRPISYANQTYGPGTPRGFVQQPTPRSTPQIVGPPANPPQPISYTSQTYGPAAPSRGFIQQPTPGSTPQNVGSPAIPSLSVLATGTHNVPTPQPNYYASQNYGPADPSHEYPKTNF